ncbi:hypothetical protein HEP87_52450 [Streptomyces sp. S1D4-11]
MNTVGVGRDGVHDALGSDVEAAAWLRAVADRIAAETGIDFEPLDEDVARPVAVALRELRDALRRLGRRGRRGSAADGHRARTDTTGRDRYPQRARTGVARACLACRRAPEARLPWPQHGSGPCRRADREPGCRTVRLA